MAPGTLPFRGDTSGVIFDAILNREPVGPVRLNPDLPAKLEEIINRAMEKDRDLRYQHASDLGAELQRLKRDRSSGPLHVSSSGHQEPARRELQPVTSPAPPQHSRRKSYYYAAAALLVLGAVTGGLFLFRSSQSRPPVRKDWEELTFFHDS